VTQYKAVAATVGAALATAILLALGTTLPPFLLYIGVVVVCGFELGVAARAMNRRIVRFLLFFGIGLIHGLVPLIGVDYQMFGWHPSIDARRTAPLISLLAIASMAAAWHLADYLARRRPSEPLWELGRNRQDQRTLALVAAASGVGAVLATLIVFISRAGSVSAFTQGSRFEYRNGGGFFTVIAQQFITLAPVPGFFAFLLHKRQWRLACIVFSVGFSGWYYFATRGTRSVPLGVLGAVVIGYVMTRKPRRSASLFVTAAVVLGTLLAVGFYSVRRDLGHLSVGSAFKGIVTVDTYREALNTDPLNYHQQFLASIDFFPAEHRYLRGATYRRIVLLPVPAAFFPGLKPPDTHITFGETITRPGTKLSLPPSLLGDGWINFNGPAGAVGIMVVWGFLGAYVDRLLASRSWAALVVGPSLVRVLILFLRGQPYEVILILVVAWLSFDLLFRVLGGQRFLRRSQYVRQTAVGRMRQPQPSNIAAG
jgi:hypothetical protein